MKGGVGSTSVPGATECGCLACQEMRSEELRSAKPVFSDSSWWHAIPGMDPHFRYACEICGNKRCPHHTDHNLECTGSNATGQPGSVYQ